MYERVVEDATGTDQLETIRTKYIKIICQEISSSFLQEYRGYVKYKFPDHESLDYIPQSTAGYMFGPIYRSFGYTPLNCESVYRALIKISDAFCETDKKRKFLSDLIKTNLSYEFSIYMSNFLFKAVAGHPLIDHLQ